MSPESNRKNAIQLVINVAKVGQLSVNRHGDISLLSDSISCRGDFAKKVLTAIKDNKVNDIPPKHLL